jgi:alpha-beta hydrolase superfamily lysophospholipase
MRRLGKWIARVLALLVILAGLLWVFGPYEPADLDARSGGAVPLQGLSAYLADREARFPDIVPGTEKRVVWAGEPEARTPVAVLYIHGFSATSEEIRPVPDRLAEALDANLVFTRLEGHGRPGDALAGATVAGWMRDLDEALKVARRAGERVLILSTSTGGTLAAVVAMTPDLREDVAGIIFVSPNFGVNSGLAPILTWPAARVWLPLVAGRRRSFEPASEAQARYWTTDYPTVSVLPMAALVKAVRGLDPGRATVPALFWFSDADRVVRPDVTAEIAARWGAPAEVVRVTTGPGDDPQAHVIAGDIMSPGQTDAAVSGMIDWARRTLAR